MGSVVLGSSSPSPPREGQGHQRQRRGEARGHGPPVRRLRGRRRERDRRGGPPARRADDPGGGRKRQPRTSRWSWRRHVAAHTCCFLLLLLLGDARLHLPLERHGAGPLERLVQRHGWPAGGTLLPGDLVSALAMAGLQSLVWADIYKSGS